MEKMSRTDLFGTRIRISNSLDVIQMPIFATQPPQTTTKAIESQLKPEIEIVSPAYDTTTVDTGNSIHFYDALDSLENKQKSGFELKTAQVGATTNRDIKDRIVVGANLSDVIGYKGQYEAFQNDESILDGMYFRNEVYFTKIGSEYFSPLAVIKVGKDDKFYLKDAKLGVINTTIPKMLHGNGRMHVTTNMKEFTGLLSYAKNLTDDLVLDITGESTFGGGKKPFMYIEGELQKYFKSGFYIFTRGEIDNQGLENKLVFGIGYSPK